MKLSFGLRFVLPFAAVIAVAQSDTQTWVRPTNPVPPSAPKPEASSSKEIEARRQRALDLIRSSHLINQQIAVGSDLTTLANQQIQIASRLDLELAAIWAREAFEMT